MPNKTPEIDAQDNMVSTLVGKCHKYNQGAPWDTDIERKGTASRNQRTSVLSPNAFHNTG